MLVTSKLLTGSRIERENAKELRLVPALTDGAATQHCSKPGQYEFDRKDQGLFGVKFNVTCLTDFPV